MLRSSRKDGIFLALVYAGGKRSGGNRASAIVAHENKKTTHKQKKEYMKKVNLDRGHNYPFALVAARASEALLLFAAARVSPTRK